MKTNSDDSAYPEINTEKGYGERSNYSDVSNSGGLTKREYFAGLAMQGLCGSRAYNEDRFITADILAIDSVKIADFLIAELNK